MPVPPPERPPVAAVLFDLDGVLADSFDVWLAVVNDARRRFGGTPVTREALLRIFGQGISDDMKNLYPGRTREEIQQAYQEAMPRCLSQMTLNPEAVTVLEALKARGIRRAVVTNTQQSLAGAVLKNLGLVEHLDAWSGVGAGVREKPAPDLLVNALAHLGLPAESALMVGDSDYDARAAAAAGVRFLRYEIRSGARLTEALSGALGVALA